MVILNSGSLNNASLTKTGKFDRYSTQYVVGQGNRSYRELVRICDELIAKAGLNSPKLPWKLDERTGMVTISASSKKPVPVADSLGKKVEATVARDGEFCKINVTPSAYRIEEPSSYVTPDGLRHSVVNTKEGISLFLNGVKLVEEATELFG
jgi:hypothetical protein